MEVGMIRRVDIDQEMQQSYLDYAMSVIVARALPDARDGLKPVHRRILHAMHSMGIRPDSNYKKSARIVGEVLGKYHPHGDAAVYDAMARMAQDFSMRYPLISGQGNFGSVDGDPPAAMRYTEARVAPIASEMLADIERDTVDYLDNFDGSLQEPSVLPAAIPNLLVNGATGIAVGMASSIPPHNLGEVCDALTYMLENWSSMEKISLDKLMKFIRGPDFPTGGIIVQGREDGESLANAYGSGRGKVTIQARAHVEEMGRGRSRIIVTELPFQTNKARLIERIAAQARAGRLEGISDLRDESDRQGMRIVLELAKTADPDKVLTQLYRRTPMQGTFSLIILALVDGEPRLLNLKNALRIYLEHRQEVIARRSEFELTRARNRAHILEGLKIALENIDDVIKMIRTASDAEEAQARLERRLKLTEIQAQAILDMPLRRLSSLERKKIISEYKEIMAEIKQLEALLKSPKKMRNLISQGLEAIKDQYADRRRTQIVSSRRRGRSATPLTASDVAPDKPTWVVISSKGLISRTPSARYPRLSGRAAPRLVLGANARDTLYLFCGDGQATALKVHTLPECEDMREGSPLHAATPLPPGSQISSGFSLAPKKVAALGDKGYVFFCTAAGVVKKTALSLLPGASAKPFLAIKVAKGDRLGWARITSGADDLILTSSSGLAIRFSESDVRPMGLSAAGVLGMRLDQAQAEIVSADVIRSGADLLLMSENGLAKRTALSQFPRQGRNGKGVLAWKSSEGIRIVGAAVGSPSDRASVILQRAAARSIRLKDAPRLVRTSSGVSLFELKEDDRVTALSPIVPRPELAIAARKPRPKTAKSPKPRTKKSSKS